MINFIRYSDSPEEAPEDYKIISTILKIVKTLIPVGKEKFTEDSIELATELAISQDLDVSFMREAMSSLLIDD